MLEHQIHELRDELREIRAIVQEIQKLIPKFEALTPKPNKFIDYPPWLTKSQALEILPFKSWKSLKQAVTLGLIRVKQINKKRELVYSKEDCLKYPENWEKRQQLKAVI